MTAVFFGALFALACRLPRAKPAENRKS